MSTLSDISISKMNPILAFTTSINVLLIVLTIYRLLTLHRAWSNDGVRTPFRKFVLLVLYTYLLSQCIGVIGRVLQACKRDADNVLNGKVVGDGTGMMCGVVYEGWDVLKGTGNAWGILTAVLWITTDVLTFTSGKFFILVPFVYYFLFLLAFRAWVLHCCKLQKFKLQMWLVIFCEHGSWDLHIQPHHNVSCD